MGRMLHDLAKMFKSEKRALLFGGEKEKEIRDDGLQLQSVEILNGVDEGCNAGSVRHSESKCNGKLSRAELAAEARRTILASFHLKTEQCHRLLNSILFTDWWTRKAYKVATMHSRKLTTSTLHTPQGPVDIDSAFRYTFLGLTT